MTILYQVTTKDDYELPIMQNANIDVIAYQLHMTVKDVKRYIKTKKARFGRYYITSIEIDESETISETD